MKFEVPAGMTQQDVIDAMERVARRLAPNFKFGSHTVDDIKQQAYLYACQGLASYDPSRPLDNFLFTHVRNRLINFKRDNHKRTDCPCRLCYAMLPGHTKHEDGKFCDKFNVWNNRNVRKQNVISPLDIGNISDENEPTTRYESTISQDVETIEILEKIDRELPVELRISYLHMKEGLSVPKSKRLEIELVVNEILGGDLDGRNNYTD